MLTIDEIREKAVPLARKYQVKQMLLFGSYADGTATEGSDVDFLVEFPNPWSICELFGLKEELQDGFGMEIDVVPLPLPRPEKLKIYRTEKII
ncbi:MAG: nucleotidyltransferase domain-containing protein [Oscillospiraceae bacterium]|nr:nucleotidyltransferase domain-containing protein [Oscillospiraceae bacterium]